MQRRSRRKRQKLQRQRKTKKPRSRRKRKNPKQQRRRKKRQPLARMRQRKQWKEPQRQPKQLVQPNPHRLPKSQQKVRMQKQTKRPLYQIRKRQLRLQKRAVPRITAKIRKMYLQSRKEALELPHHPQPSRQKKALRKRTMFPRLAPRIWLEWGFAPLQRYM